MSGWDLAMGGLPSTKFAFGTFVLIAVMEATNPASAQNINVLLTIFGGDRQRALRHAALAEWRRLPPAEIACMDQGLRQKGSSADALVRRGVKPSAAGLAELRSSCHRQFVQGVQTETAQRATDAFQAGSPAPPIDVLFRCQVSRDLVGDGHAKGVGVFCFVPFADSVSASVRPESPRSSPISGLSRKPLRSGWSLFG